MKITDIYDIKKEMTFIHVFSDVGIARKPRKCLLANLCVNLQKMKTLNLHVQLFGIGLLYQALGSY